MTTKKTHDLTVSTGSYTDRDGNEKKRWLNVGAAFEGDHGMFLRINRAFNPAGIGDGDSIIVSMFDSKPRGERQEQRSEPKDDGFGDSEIPF